MPSASINLFEIVKTDELSAFGSIFAVAGGIVAIIWFNNTLQQQSIQPKEQRQQFQLEFNNLRLEWKRSTIALAKTLLDDMEDYFCRIGYIKQFSFTIHILP